MPFLWDCYGSVPSESRIFYIFVTCLINLTPKLVHFQPSFSSRVSENQQQVLEAGPDITLYVAGRLDVTSQVVRTATNRITQRVQFSLAEYA